jgi:hypothetical protein
MELIKRTKTDKRTFESLNYKKYDGYGYIYIIEFESGAIKVGMTTNFNQRLKTHRTTLGRVSPVLRFWVSVLHSNYLENEKELIEFISYDERSEVTFKSSFDVVRREAELLDFEQESRLQYLMRVDTAIESKPKDIISYLDYISSDFSNHVAISEWLVEESNSKDLKQLKMDLFLVMDNDLYSYLDNYFLDLCSDNGGGINLVGKGWNKEDKDPVIFNMYPKDLLDDIIPEIRPIVNYRLRQVTS